MEKAVKHCSNCSTKYTVEWNEEEQDLEPLTCPFCGFEVEEEWEMVDGSIELTVNRWIGSSVD